MPKKPARRRLGNKKAKTDPQPIRFDAEEMASIKDLQKMTTPKLSVSEVVRRAVRFSAPKFLKGEAPLIVVNLAPAATT